MPTAQGWHGGPDADRRRRASRSTPSPTGLKHPRWIARAAQRRRARRRGADACRARIKTAFDYAIVTHDAARGGGRRQPQPHHAAARRRRRRRRRDRATTFLEGLNQPFGMALVGDTFYVGNTDGVVAFPYAAGADADHRARPQARRPSSPAATGRAACCRAPTAPSSMSASARSPTSATSGMEAEEGRAGDLRDRPRDRREPHLRLAACATRSAWPGSRRPARSGPWSTSATASATRPRPTT